MATPLTEERTRKKARQLLALGGIMRVGAYGVEEVPSDGRRNLKRVFANRKA